MYSCHLFLISSAYVRPITFLSFIMPIFAWNIPLASLIFLTRSLVFPILSVQFSSVHFSCSVVSDSVHSFLLFLFTDHWGRLIAPCNSLKQPSGGYISFPPLLFASLLFTAIFKAHLTSHSRMSGSRWVTPLWFSGSWRSFLYSSSVYSLLNIFCFC